MEKIEEFENIVRDKATLERDIKKATKARDSEIRKMGNEVADLFYGFYEFCNKYVKYLSNTDGKVSVFFRNDSQGNYLELKNNFSAFVYDKASDSLLHKPSNIEVPTIVEWEGNYRRLVNGAGPYDWEIKNIYNDLKKVVSTDKDYYKEFIISSVRDKLLLEKSNLEKTLEEVTCK